MPRTILVVDDNSINRQILRNVLRGEYDVAEADGGAQAIAYLVESKAAVSAVLLDLVMPEIDGYEVLKARANDPALAQIPVIVTTSSAEKDAEKKALALGANDYVLKPFDADIIRRRLHNLIRLRETSVTLNALQRDALTGLWNRETFFIKADEAIRKQTPGYYVLACLDIDGFKVLNDQLGTPKGDEVLKCLADGLRECEEGTSSLLGRITADNFVALYPRSILDQTPDKAKRLESRVQERLGVNITLSIGRYMVDDAELAVSTMYDRAKIAQESIKGRYDTRVAVYDEAMRARILRQQEIIGEMNEALAAGQFEAWYQPQYDHSSGALTGAEALARWRHPTRGLIPPGEFIPVFERNGFIYEMDTCIWEDVCRRQRKWLDEGLDPLPVSVNVSRCDLLRDDLADVIDALLRKYDLPANLIHLEITESAFSQSARQVVETVERLVERGYTVEIDDFGSGYSSLNTLKDVPAQVVKLDMRFLDSGGHTSRGGNILESIVRMTKWLNMSVIAEGVEDAAQADFLRSIGCNRVQGYLYARPMPAAEYETLANQARKERKTQSLETIANLNSNAFWDPKSMDTLIFNSYAGAACVFEYCKGHIEMLRVNDQYAQAICGDKLRTQDMLRLDWSAHMDEATRKSLDSAILLSAGNKEAQSGEYNFTGLPVGEKDICLRSSLRVIASTGDRYLVYCATENITAQRKAEREKRETDDQLKMILANMYGGVAAVTRSGTSYRYIFTNARFREIFGYTERQFAEELPDDFLATVCRVDRARVMAAVRENETTGSVASIEYAADRRDGVRILVSSTSSVLPMSGIPTPVHIVVIYDTTKVSQVSDKLRESEEKLRFLNDTAHILLAQPDNESGITRLLMNILAYFGGARAYVFERNAEQKTVGNSYEVCAPGVPSERSELQDMPYEEMQHWWTQFDNRGYVYIDDVGKLGANREGEKSTLEKQGIRSLAAVPLRRGGETIGFVGVDNPTRDHDHIDQLRALGDYMTMMLTRRDMDDRIKGDTVALRGLMEDTPGGLVRLKASADGALKPVFANEGFLRLLGMSEIEWRTNPIADLTQLVHPDDVVTAKTAFEQMDMAGETNNARYRIRKNDGSFVWVRVFGRMSKSARGEAFYSVYYAGISDSEQKNLSMQERLTVALHALLADSEDIVFVKDTSLRYICGSRPMAALCGISDPRELAGKTDSELFGTELGESYTSVDRRVLETRKPTHRYLAPLPAKDGVARYADTHKYPLFDAAGNVIGVLGISRDTTEERTAFARLRLLTNSVPGGIASYMYTQGSFRIVYFNDGVCRLTGHTREEYASLCERDILATVFPEDAPRVRAQINTLIERDAAVDCSFRVRTKDGETKWVRMRCSTGERSDQVCTFNAVLYDITSQKASEEALRVRETEYRLAVTRGGRLVYRYSHADRSLEIPQDSQLPQGLRGKLKGLQDSILSQNILAEESKQAFVDLCKAVRRGDASGTTTLHLKNTEGEWRWYEARFTTVNDDDKRPVSAIIVTKDVTDSREEHITEEMNRKRLLAALGSIYPLIVSVNLSKNSYKTVSSREAMLDTGAEEGTIKDLIDTASARMEPEYATKFRYQFQSDNIMQVFARVGDSLRVEYRHSAQNGIRRWVELVVIRTQNDYNDDLAGVIIGRFIDAQKETEAKLRLADMDGMTGLYNKTAAETQIAARMARSAHTACAMLVADLDSLKSINDTFGHAEGDAAIRALAGHLRGQFRQTDIVGRVGGDEFVAYLEGITGAHLNNLMTSFMRKLSALRVGPKKDWPLKASVGVAVGGPEDTYESLFSKADKALYHVKRNGRDDFAFYTPDMETDSYRHSRHEATLSNPANRYDNNELNRLLEAVSGLYPMIISANLTQNSYYMLRYVRYTTRKCPAAGVFDELIATGAETFHPDDRVNFLKRFERKNLLAACERGERIVAFVGRQKGDDGIYRNIRTEVVFVQGENGDILEITLAGEERKA